MGLEEGDEALQVVAHVGLRLRERVAHARLVRARGRVRVRVRVRVRGRVRVRVRLRERVAPARLAGQVVRGGVVRSK